MDAQTIDAWVTNHTGTGNPPGSAFYWDTAYNLHSTSVAGHPAIYFEDTIAGAPTSGHNTAFVQGSSRVFLFNWWSTDSTYSANIQLVAQQMLASFQG